MRTHDNEPFVLRRDVKAVMVPAGIEIELKSGQSGFITQALGGSFTLYMEGNLFRLAGSEADAIGIGMRNDVEDARRDHAVDLAAGLLDRFDFEAELIERVGDVGRWRFQRRELANPAERCPHQNCLAKRTSPSQMFFTWSTP